MHQKQQNTKVEIVSNEKQTQINARDRLLDLTKTKPLTAEEKEAIKLDWMTPFKK